MVLDVLRFSAILYTVPWLVQDCLVLSLPSRSTMQPGMVNTVISHHVLHAEFSYFSIYRCSMSHDQFIHKIIKETSGFSRNIYSIKVICLDF